MIDATYVKEKGYRCMFQVQVLACESLYYVALNVAETVDYMVWLHVFFVLFFFFQHLLLFFLERNVSADMLWS